MVPGMLASSMAGLACLVRGRKGGKEARVREAGAGARWTGGCVPLRLCMSVCLCACVLVCVYAFGVVACCHDPHP